jgi:hypothetical protein
MFLEPGSVSTASGRVRLDVCWDPLKCHKKDVLKGLRQVSEETRTIYRHLNFPVKAKLCTDCRKRFTALKATQTTASATLAMAPAPQKVAPATQITADVGDSDDEQEQLQSCASVSTPAKDAYVSPDHELSILNESLSVIGQSPIDRKKVKRPRYVERKAKSIKFAVKRKLELVTGSEILEKEEGIPDHNAEFIEMIDQLKNKFQSCKKRSEKVQVLTVLPKSWSIKKITDEFQTSNYMARKAKKLVRTSGVLSTPNPKLGKTLKKKTARDVQAFYNCDSISRVMPGKKDYISISIDGERHHAQKRLVLCNLKEAFQQFKEQNPETKIGFSKFAELRPKECILAGDSGTHAVCVCTIHQNTKLMMIGAKLDQITAGRFKHYRHCLASIQCNPPRIECFLGQCENCPGVDVLHEELERSFDEFLVDQVEYRKWTTTDRSTLETKVQTVDEFLRSFIGMLPKLLHHDFIAMQQSNFLRTTKERLQPGEFLIVGDFAENYSFILQDAAQSFHWNNLQATLHPFVCYYRKHDQNDPTELSHISFVVISESNTHDTAAVHLFQKLLLEFLATNVEKPRYIFYFSDGCAAQYKNRKNFINLCHHQKDFGIPAEWHFFATSHGKGPCDGVGGTVKRLAARASLQRPYENQIMTPRQLFEFGQSDIKSVNFIYTTLEQHDEEGKLLHDRFAMSRTIPGTHGLHSFRPISEEKIEIREFSASPKKRTEFVSINTNEPTDSAKILSYLDCSIINGYVTAEYDGYWWLACVLNTMAERGKN